MQISFPGLATADPKRVPFLPLGAESAFTCAQAHKRSRFEGLAKTFGPSPCQNQTHQSGYHPPAGGLVFPHQHDQSELTSWRDSNEEPRFRQLSDGVSALTSSYLRESVASGTCVSMTPSIGMVGQNLGEK